MNFDKKLTYCLIVTGSPFGSQKALSAYQFANALINNGHNLKTIFFYHEGVFNSNKLNSPSINEFNLIKAWQQIAKKTSCQMLICISAALRRGVISDNKKKISTIYDKNLANRFKISGLMSLAESIITTDRTIQF